MSIGTIISLALVSICICKTIQTRSDVNQNSTYYRVFGTLRMERHNTLRLCGQALTEAMTAACMPTYGYNNKRSKIIPLNTNQINELIPTEDMLYITEKLFENFINQEKHRFTRHVRSAPQECCANSCTYETLLSYCNTTSNTRP
ncbi:uncharacterized protein LOC128961586 [Oppia nitens]|uniref:uncharacterized protein LOC128961586 n=1 Tax=Oppia nitens TaxID=1686743 RepID=UPI0023DB8283|nr:uncharacterized protein LOC128961586 [Oppia nitens]